MPPVMLMTRLARRPIARATLAQVIRTRSYREYNSVECLLGVRWQDSNSPQLDQHGITAEA